MTGHHAPTLSSDLAAPSDIDKRRVAAWLRSSYSDPVWTVTDTRDHERKAKIDFRERLADGRPLLEAERLCATVKEYAWWVRDPRFSRIDDAYTHSAMVKGLIYLAHALTLRGIWTFAHLQPFDVEQLVEECRYGTDAVLHASERVEVYLQGISAANAVNRKPFGGLPRYLHRSGSWALTVHSEQIMVDCNLPSGPKWLPRVSTLIGRAAKANGLNTYGKLRDLEPLPNITVQALRRWLDPLEQLHAMRRRIEAEAISFKPFPLGAARVAAVKGVGVDRTPAPPPMLALYLIEHSARCVLDHGNGPLAKPADLPRVRHVATACWILIAAFTARRDKEINDLRDGCLRGDDDSGWWLHIMIDKTLQREEWIPIPRLVVRAVKAMTTISAVARRETGSDHLFQWLGSSGNSMRLDVSSYLDGFAAAVETPLHVPRGGVGVVWHWHPHQFRRFFAILYFYRFEGATIEVLSHQLRHFSLEMTKRYVTQDPEAAALWTDVEWGYMGHVARSIVSGERSVSGGAGERLKKIGQRLIDRFRRMVHIAPVDRVGASLTIIMQRQGVVLTPMPWVTCASPRTRDAAARAACRRQGPEQTGAIGPDFANAAPSVCPACPYAITEGSRQEFIDAEVRHLEAAAASSSRSGSLFGVLEKARVLVLTKAQQFRYKDASPVERPARDERGNA